MELITVAYFFAVIIGLGYSFAQLMKLDKFNDPIEKAIFLIGLGLVAFVLVSIPLSIFHNLVWYNFLIIAMLLPIYHLCKKRYKEEILLLRIPKEYIIVGLVTVLLFCVYLAGAFSYSYLEDADPWEHSKAAKYVSIYHTYYQPDHLPFHYLEPYPPFYSTFMGVLHQLHFESIQWTLKFFNVLLIAFSLPFAYIWLRKFTKSEKVAVMSTFLLASLPSFMSHFIWAQTLSLLLWFPALYSIEKLKEEKNKRWLTAASLVIATILITQPSTAFIFGIFFIFYFLIEFLIHLKDQKNIIETFKNKQVRYLFLAGILGLAVSLSIYWIPEIVYRGEDKVFGKIGITPEYFKGGTKLDTSGGVIYGIEDFIVAPLVTRIDQPTGLGGVVFALLIFSIFVLVSQRKKLIYEKNKYLLISLLWLVISFIGLEGNALPYKLLPHRFWVYFSIPVSIIVAFGITLIYNSIKDKIVSYTFLSLIFLGILFTSAYPKYIVQTSKWPPGGGWSSEEQILGYINLKKLPPNTKVFSMCKNPKTVIGMDKMDYPWIKDVEEYKEYALEDSLENNYRFLKRYGYQYLIIDTGCIVQFGENKTNTKLQEIIHSKNFKLEKWASNHGFFLFRVM